MAEITLWGGWIVSKRGNHTDFSEPCGHAGALGAREEQYRPLFELNPNPMWIFDEATLRVLAVNDAAVQLYGWSREEFLRMTMKDVRPPQEVSKLVPKLSRQRSSRAAFVGEWRHWKKDGTVFDVEVTISCLRFQGRDARLTMVNDITERKRVEAALRESEQWLKADLQATKKLAKLGILFARKGDLKPVLTAVVDAAIAISGADFGNIQLLDVDSAELKIVAQRGFPNWWVEFWNTTSKGQGVCGTALQQEKRVIVEDVERSPIFAGTRALKVQLQAGVHAVQCTPLVSRSGKVLGMFSTHYKTPHRPDERTLRLLDLLARQASDLIERARAEERLNHLNATLERRVATRTEELTRVNQLLLASEQALADFFCEAPLGLLWLSPEGRILRVNQALAALLGSRIEALLGRHLTGFCGSQEVALGMVRALMRGKSIHEHPLRLRRQDHSIRHALIDANGAWQDGKLTYSRWFVRDVSQRVELDKEILAAGERVRRQIGHDLHDDLCQQLTSIEYLGRALEHQLAANSPVEAAREREITSLIRQAIAYTRELSHAMSPMELATEGLPGALKDLAAQTNRLFHIDCRFQGDSSITVDDSTAQTNLYRVAQEATQNAIKHGKASHIQIGLMTKGDDIVLRVQDDGVGLPFKPHKKHGFGLRIMDYRAKALGGSLAVQKPKSGGTTLVCSIPKAPITRATQPNL